MPFTRRPYVKKTRKVYKKRSYKKTAPKSRTNLVRLIKNIHLKQSESKSKMYSIAKTELYHNTYTNLGELNTVFQMPEQGVGDNMRVGDRIHSSGYKVKLLCGQKYDRPNITWKFWVLQQPTGAGFSNNFKNQTGNVLLDGINTEQAKILKAFTWKPCQSSMMKAVSGVENSLEFTFTKSFWVPHRHEYKFTTDAQKYHDESPIILACACYDAYGTLTTDNISYIQVYTELFYRDT